MATIQENALPSKSSIVAADKLRAIGSDSKSYQALVSDVAKYIVENYNGSTLAGSAQSVQSALSELNSNFSGTSVIRFTADSNGIVVNVPTNFRGILCTFDSSPNRLGMYFLYRVGSSSGLANMKTIVSASDLTFDTTDPGKLKISSPGMTVCAIWNVNNKVTIES